MIVLIGYMFFVNSLESIFVYASVCVSVYAYVLCEYIFVYLYIKHVFIYQGTLLCIIE